MFCFDIFDSTSFKIKHGYFFFVEKRASVNHSCFPLNKPLTYFF